MNQHVTDRSNGIPGYEGSDSDDLAAVPGLQRKDTEPMSIFFAGPPSRAHYFGDVRKDLVLVRRPSSTVGGADPLMLGGKVAVVRERDLIRTESELQPARPPPPNAARSLERYGKPHRHGAHEL